MKNKKFIIYLCALLAFIFAGCSAKEIVQKNDEAYIKRYVTASLNVLYKNDSKDYVELKLGSKEDAQILYEKMLDSEVKAFVENSNRTDENEIKEWREILGRVIGNVKFKTESAEMRDDESFLVILSYEQYKIFEAVVPEYMEMVKQNAQTWMDNSKDEDEYNSKVMAVYREVFLKHLENPAYKETQKAEIVVRKNADGLYEISDETHENIERLLLDVQFAEEYVENIVVNQSGVTLGKYKGVEAKREDIKITDEDVDIDIYSQLSSFAEPAGHERAEKWDVVYIDFVGKIDGIAYEECTAKNYALTLGTQSFIDGFEDGLIGAIAGESIDLNLKFPENYGDERFDGKDVVFTVTVNRILTIPALTDEFVKQISGYDTLAELKEFVRTSLEEEAEEYVEKQFQNAVLEAIINDSSFDETLANEISVYEKMLVNQYEEYAKSYNVTLADFVEGSFGLTLDEFYSEIKRVADFDVKCDRVLKAVAKAEGFTVTDQEYEATVATIMEQTGIKTLAEVEAQYGKDEIFNSILSDKALEYILGNAVVIK